METAPAPAEVSTNRSNSTGRMALAALSLLPALFCCISQLLLPTLNTFLMSLQRIRLLGSENTFVGAENYGVLLGDEGFRRAAGFTFAMLLVRLAMVSIAPLGLAWAASHFGRPLRSGLRVLLTAPVALFMPAASAVTWLLFLNPANGLLAGYGSWLASPTSARGTLLFVDALYVFGLACGLGLIAFLPLWRRPADAARPTFREVLKPMLAVWVAGLLGVIALTVSTFSLNLVMTGGGPAGSTTTLGMLMYNLAFRNFNMGPAAAVASLLLLATMALGVITGLVVILARLRLNIVDAGPAPETSAWVATSKGSRPLAGIVLIVLGLLALGACLSGVLPYGWLVTQAFGDNGLARLLEEIPPAQIVRNSLLPPVVAATMQVLLAYLAALGIGALRPLGKRSEWLLLLFSPWLFISVLPLSLANYTARQEAGQLNTLAGSISPILFSVPALFVLTLFFAGRASARVMPSSEAAPNFMRHFVWPSLPLAGVLWLLLLFVNGSDLVWSLLVNASLERYNVNVMLLQLAAQFGGGDAILAALITLFILPFSVFFFAGLAAFQVFYLDRLTSYAEASASGAVTNPEERGLVG